MTNTVERITKLLKIAAIVSVAIAILRRVRGSRPEVTGSARWKPLGDATPPPERTGPVKFAEEAPPAADSSSVSWVEPVDGTCPASHPIKGNANSGIFHVPGGGSYERTVPERCYASPSDAEADGFRPAKR